MTQTSIEHAHFAPLPALEQPEQTIDQNLERSAMAFPERDAIIFQGHHLSYASLWQMVERLAGYLQHQLDLKLSEPVLLYMQNSPQFVIAHYAILRAGGVVILANPMSKEKELTYLAKKTGSRIVIAGGELLKNVKGLMANDVLSHTLVVDYRDLAAPEERAALPEPLEATFPTHSFKDACESGPMPCARAYGPDDLSAVPFSSGTTGEPKGCMHTHRTMMATVLSNGHWLNLPDDCVHLATMPFFHVTGLQCTMNVALYFGHTQVILHRWNAERAAHLIESHGVGCWVSISTMLIDLLNDEAALGYDLSSLKVLSGGGAAMPKAVAQKLKERIGKPYIEGYGMSETMAGTHINPPDAPKQQCLGVPIYGVDARVLIPDGLQEQPVNEEGEIVVNAPQVFKGYWDDPEATQAAFVELDGKPFLRTGDIGYRDPEGYFFLVDRLKRMVNVSGFKVWPTEVEAVLYGHPAIKEVCIVGVKDARRGEQVKAHVVLAEGAELTAEELITWCHANLSAYKCPREVAFDKALPRSDTGKVLWRTLS